MKIYHLTREFNGIIEETLATENPLTAVCFIVERAGELIGPPMVDETPENYHNKYIEHVRKEMDNIDDCLVTLSTFEIDAIPTTIIKNMDWELLKEQRQMLIDLSNGYINNHLGENIKLSPIDNQLIDGIINFFDSFVDFAIDECNLNENDVLLNRED